MAKKKNELPDLSLRQIQMENAAWSKRNFPENPKYAPLLGVVEELGELSHSYLKIIQGIRGTKKEHMQKIEDAIGDLTIFMCDFCSRHNFDYQRVVNKTWNEVKHRDWTKNKKNGQV